MDDERGAPGKLDGTTLKMLRFGSGNDERLPPNDDSGKAVF